MELLILAGVFLYIGLFLFIFTSSADNCPKGGKHSWAINKDGKFTKLYTDSILGGVYSDIGREVICRKCKEIRGDDGEHDIDWNNENK